MPEIDLTLGTGLMIGVAAYLLGSVPFGLVIAHLMGLGNLREIGSGNIGATNVLRTGNRPAAFLTLILDAGKGAVAVLVARVLFGEAGAQLAGLAAFLGHLFPVWLHFRGGKGVATFLGLLLGLSFPAGVAVCLCWLATAALVRMSSAAALVSAVVAPIWCAVLGYPAGAGLCSALALLIWWSHRSNIKRILAGTEPRIGKK